MASTIYLVLLLFFFCMVAEAQDVEFLFDGFNGREADLTLDRVSIIKPSGLLRLTNETQNAVGHAFYSQKIQMLNRSSSSSPNDSSFSTTFVFQIISPSIGEGGFGLAFTLSPSDRLPGADAGHFLGLFNSNNNGDSSNNIFAVEFDTVNGFNESTDSEGNHVGININSVDSVAGKPASYIDDANRLGSFEELLLDSGKPIQAWIEYDGVTKLINVTIAPMGQDKPIQPLIPFQYDLSKVVREDMYAGFSASTGEKASSHYILGWSFSTKGAAPPLNLSRLPLAVPEKKSSSFRPSVIAIIASLCGVTTLLFVILFFVTVYRRKWLQFEALEDWELDSPHRFRYQDLHTATKGFKKSEIIGAGGFGTVYRGRLPTSAIEVAVKKINQNSIQGLREFTAEIESLGCLRHKNLVNLQGWCKTKKDLLLVYEFIPNGSLAGLLFSRENSVVLSWEQRFNIVKGIAAGLLYLHEEWGQVVIHRDVKSSNVLIDAEMNGRLGDFGLARLYNHGTTSHTTNIVGTIGYLAPELTRTGQASTGSDVYAYGILLLEVACGRKPVETSDFILIDSAIEYHRTGGIIDAADPKLNSAFVVEEMELVLGLGLLCSHRKPNARPTMRQVTRYLNWEAQLPVIDDLGSPDSPSSRPKFMEVSGSSNMITGSYPSSSLDHMSTGSIDAGR
ncbi:L-TYPE LECTIN-DOMAIN CONTAINING RECEPTOR KINASE VI.1-RELATED [Salix purpurea]|uniref:non-specific serine/threonine protein kinase n=1 Tax=Salix purpurea TaxID=77065 RepID=A0A9Q0Q3S3_SALPP|nr:L-TYPE LECTIN-DOMAIN CONTAINING RECEPTOR KINASE VI.1-RELATED [Salix purpurea]